MKKEKKYQLVIFTLLIIAVLEAVFLITLKPKREIKAPPAGVAPIRLKGKIAFVMDDWGYNLNNMHALGQIRYPLTLSILPGLNYSRTIAEEGKRLGQGIILHLPMESNEKFRLEQNTILISMDKARIDEIMAGDFGSVPYCSGVSNHMGSTATEDLKTMKIVFDELKKRNLFFLDSFVTNKSICSGLADKMKVRFIRRDIFLDNKNDPDYIKKQIYKLKVRARIKGAAVGIGHDRPITLAVLKEAMPELEKEGYKIVYVSDLVR